MISVARKQRIAYEVPLSHVVELERAGRLPKLPTEVEAYNNHGRHHPAGTILHHPRCWLIGDLYEPRGVLVTDSRFDPSFGREVVVIEHVAGTRRAVVDLLRFAILSRAVTGIPLVGEIDVQNRSMARLINALAPSARIEKVKWVL